MLHCCCLISGRGALTRGWFCSFPRCWKAMGQGASKTCKRGGRPCCWSCCYLGVVCGWALLLGCLNCHPSGLWNHIISPVKAPFTSSGYSFSAGFTWNVARPITMKEVNEEQPAGFQHQQCLISSAEILPSTEERLCKKITSESNFRDSTPEDSWSKYLPGIQILWKRKPVWWFSLQGVGVCNRRVWKANQVPFDALCAKWAPVESRNQWFWAMVCSTCFCCVVSINGHSLKKMLESMLSVVVLKIFYFYTDWGVVITVSLSFFCI